MDLIERACPLCSSRASTVLVSLRQEHFTKTNPTYRLDRVPLLEFDPGQEWPIVRCVECGFAYAPIVLDDAREAIVYNEIIDADKSRAKILSVGRKRGDLMRAYRLLSLVDSAEQLKLLDYGCGWGSLLRLAEGLGIRGIGFDATSWKTDWARRNGVTILASREEVAREAPFDLAVSTSVLEHLHDPREAVEWMAQVLRPGGVALIDCVVGAAATPESWGRIRASVAAGVPLPKEINPWEHLNYFTNDQLATMLGEYGFRPVEARGEWIAAEVGLRGAFDLVVRPRLGRTRPSWFGYWRLER